MFGIKFGIKSGKHVVPIRGLLITYSDKTGQLVFFKDGGFRGAMQGEKALEVLTDYWHGLTQARAEGEMMEHSCERKWESRRVYFDSGHWYFGRFCAREYHHLLVYHCPYCGVKLEPPVKVDRRW